jgi:hypothetical protein
LRRISGELAFEEAAICECYRSEALPSILHPGAFVTVSHHIHHGSRSSSLKRREPSGIHSPIVPSNFTCLCCEFIILPRSGYTGSGCECQRPRPVLLILSPLTAKRTPVELIRIRPTSMPTIILPRAIIRVAIFVHDITISVTLSVSIFASVLPDF